MTEGGHWKHFTFEQSPDNPAHPFGSFDFTQMFDVNSRGMAGPSLGALDMGEWMEGMIAMTSGHWNKMLASLERSEGEGKFRRLLPVEELQSTPGSTLLKEHHPQWVIGRGAQTP